MEKTTNSTSVERVWWLWSTDTSSGYLARVPAIIVQDRRKKLLIRTLKMSGNELKAVDRWVSRQRVIHRIETTDVDELATLDNVEVENERKPVVN